MSPLQPINLWSHWGAPNPWKVIIILEELSIPYTTNNLEFDQVKQDSYLAVNPNGRLPTIQDPNTELTLWESGAIIQYLIEQYDTSHKLSYDTLPEKYHAQQWLAFQISGQGPYFGQATWFVRFHSERLPSATKRYIDEIFRVTGVLELGLKRNGTGWLVGDKCTYADLSFVTWAWVGEGLLKEVGSFEGFEERYPEFMQWMARMAQRDVVGDVRARVATARAEHGLN